MTYYKLAAESQLENIANRSAFGEVTGRSNATVCTFLNRSAQLPVLGPTSLCSLYMYRHVHHVRGSIDFALVVSHQEMNIITGHKGHVALTYAQQNNNNKQSQQHCKRRKINFIKQSSKIIRRRHFKPKIR